MRFPTSQALAAVLAALLLATAPAAAQTSASQSAVAAEYRLGAGDVIRVSVYQNPDLQLEARLSEAGVISYPLLGTIKLGGLSVTQAEKAIADGLREGKFVKDAQVSILVVQVKGNQASVLGQVNRPGRYPIESSTMRLTDLLATAGGISAVGTDVVTVVGTRDGKTFRQQVDLPELFRSADSGGNLVVHDGDTIYVDRAPQIYIYGEVQRPGVMRLERNMTVIQALAAGGGLTQRGTEKGLRVSRRGADGNVQELTPKMDDLLQPGDVVYVRESLF